jgi:hypothetical protein
VLPWGTAVLGPHAAAALVLHTACCRTTAPLHAAAFKPFTRLLRMCTPVLLACPGAWGIAGHGVLLQAPAGQQQQQEKE